MPNTRKEDTAIITYVPFGTKAAGLTSDSLNDPREFRKRFHDALVPDSEDASAAEFGPSVYIYPKIQDLSQETANRNVEVLTESPVVYIVTFEQTEPMLHGKWLANVIEDEAPGNFRLYGRPHIVYVGETNNILNRTNQHLTAKRRFENIGDGESYDDIAVEIGERTKADKVIQKAVEDGIDVREYIVWDTYFTKSMTLDLENKFIDYFHALEDVFVLNGRGNPQRNYYMSEEKDVVCSRVWQLLSLNDPSLFPPEHDIWNSELYKISPFHALGREQSQAVNDICENAIRLLDGEPIGNERLEQTTSPNRLVIVEGASGTGKSIVVSTLFVRLSEALRQRADGENGYCIRPNSRVCLVVNQPQQLTMYTNLAKKIGLMRSNSKEDECVFKATHFLNVMREGKRERPDIVIIDEAHLLRTSQHRSYSGKRFHGNQLYDIALNAKVVIAVFDPEQVMRKSQHWNPELVRQMLPENRPREGGALTYTGALELVNSANSIEGRDTFNTYHIALTEQFRIDAGDGVIEWIDRLADPTATGIGPIPDDDLPRDPPSGVHGKKPYDIRVYSSPITLAQAIERRRAECASTLKDRASSGGEDRFSAPLCRLLATYDWAYRPSSNEGTVDLYRIADQNGSPHWIMPENDMTPEGYSGKPDDRFSRNWNYCDSGTDSDRTWSADPAADDEVGSYFSIQGFDLNYAGVIIGPSITYVDGRIVVNRSASCDSEATGEFAEELILQQFKVLIRRGIHGLYLFAVDPGLQRALEKSARESGRLDLDD